MQLLSEVTCQNIFQDPKIFLQILVQPVEENKKLLDEVIEKWRSPFYTRNIKVYKIYIA